MSNSDAVGSNDEIILIRVESGPHAGASASWGCGRFVIGRSDQAHLPLPHDLLVSPVHCRMEVSSDGCRIVDLGSRSGTLIQGKPVVESVVASGDRFRVGMTEISVKLCRQQDLDQTLIADPHLAQTSVAGLELSNSLQTASQGFLDIPGFSIRRKIGAGGMGIVYEALRLAENDAVAIKTIIPGKGTPKQAIDLFQREMQVLAALQHPHIVRFLGGGEFGGQIYLVMEYVDAVDAQALAKDLPVEQQTRLFCGIICQVLSALEYAHQLKLVHRDVKPRNILVTKAGKTISAKLADFGLAKNFEQAGLSQLTADNEIRGTPAFMPWEQLQNSRYAKPAADLYSTTATLFFYLTGKLPGHTNPSGRANSTLGTLIGLLTRSNSEKPSDSVIDGLSQLPDGLAEALNRGLASKPRDRFGTADEMRTALLPFTRPPRNQQSVR